jgi:hypothetical protein
MPRRHSLNNILLRKQLLIAEAEVHREQMRQDIQVISRAVNGMGRKAKSIGTVASVVSLVGGGFTALRAVRKSSHNGHPSLFSRLFSGAGLASTLWQGWNAIKHSRSNTPPD